MSKFVILGGLCWLVSLVLILFRTVSSLMEMESQLGNTRLTDIIGPSAVTWIDGISIDIIHGATSYIIHMPLYLLLLIVGGICFLVSSLYKG